jgi:hypothetical protein
VPAKTDGPPFDEVAEAATGAWRGAEIPAGNGHGNARSIARIQPIVSNAGEVDGVRLLSPRTIELIFDQQSAASTSRLGCRRGSGSAMASHTQTWPRIYPMVGVVLVRMGRGHRRQRPRPADDLCRCDEQDGLDVVRNCGRRWAGWRLGRVPTDATETE